MSADLCGVPAHQEVTTMTLADVAGRDTISVEEAGRILGIGRKTAYEAVQRGEIPALRIGRRLLVPTHRLRALLEGNA